MAKVSVMESAPGPETVVDGQSYLYFGGTSYLGLAAHPEVIEAGSAALRRYGVHSATSRSGFGNSPPVLDVETQAVGFFGTEAAFYFGSGYMVNHILVSAVAPGYDAILLDESSHYCVVEAAGLGGLPVVKFAPRDVSDLSDKVAKFERVIVMADAVGPASGELAPVEEYVRVLRDRSRACLILDDAHGFGVLGDAGRGLFDELGWWPLVNGGAGISGVELAVGGTLAKALGGFGGILVGTNEFVTRAKSASHYFDGASAPAAAVAGSSGKALELVRQHPEWRRQLAENGAFLKIGLRNLGLPVPPGRTAHFGVSIGTSRDMEHIHVRLKERGILLPFVGAYSGIPSEGVLRFAVFANHTREQLVRLLDELKSML